MGSNYCRAGNRQIRIAKGESLWGNCESSGQLICNVFGSLRIILGDCESLLQMDSQKDLFLSSPFFSEVLCKKKRKCE